MKVYPSVWKFIGNVCWVHGNVSQRVSECMKVYGECINVYEVYRKVYRKLYESVWKCIVKCMEVYRKVYERLL